MSTQQVVHPRSANGYGRQRVDRDMGARTESKMHSRKPAFSDVANAVNTDKIGKIGGPSRDRLVYVMSCLRGQPVEVHVKNGSIISGIFHGTNTEKDCGILLKMARITKDGSSRVQKPATDIIKKPQTYIIPAKDLFQVIAKDVSLTSDDFINEHAHERRKDLMVDSAISHPQHLDLGRELERWVPDKDDLGCPDLEKTFDGTWNRNWDQFETNKVLFGVESTFNEEIYTTKLDKSQLPRDLERKAIRIAREIEGEETHDRHLAEERGKWLNEDTGIDDESRYSAVHREVDGGRCENFENSFSDAYNDETFGSSVIDEAQPSSAYSSMGGEVSNEFQPDNFAHLYGSNDYVNQSTVPLAMDYRVDKKQIEDQGDPKNPLDENVEKDGEASDRFISDKDAHFIGSNDYVNQSTSYHVSKSLSMDYRLDKKHIKDQDDLNNPLDDNAGKAFEEVQPSKSESIESAKLLKLPSSATSYDPHSYENKNSSSGSSESAVPVQVSAANESVNPSIRPTTSTQFPSASAAAASGSSGTGLSSSSSIGSSSSDKTTLNPHAKEFKLNPNAKSFIPAPSIRTQTPTPTPTPTPEGSFYYSSNIPGVPHAHNIPVGVGFGPTFGGPLPVYNPQGAQLQSPQAYMPPNAPLYGQQMIIGQPRPMFYMPPPYQPPFQPEMSYRGRNH